MLKIISFKICPFVQRVTALLEAKGVPYQVDYISLSDKPDWFLEISPNAQVPLLITEGGKALFESEAIIEYIEEAYGPLRKGVSLEDKALERAWSYLASKNYLVQCGAMRSPSATDLEERSAKLGAAFDKIEKALGETRYFSGDEIGLVDIAWITLLYRAALIERETGFDMLGLRPKLKRWQEAVLETGLAEKSVAEDFEDRFFGFYLSEDTFLGRGKDAESCRADDACKTSSCC